VRRRRCASSSGFGLERGPARPLTAATAADRSGVAPDVQTLEPALQSFVGAVLADADR